MSFARHERGIDRAPTGRCVDRAVIPPDPVRLGRARLAASLRDMAVRVFARARRPMFVEIAFVCLGPPERGRRAVRVEPADVRLGGGCFDPLSIEPDRSSPEALRLAVQARIDPCDQVQAMRSFAGRAVRAPDGEVVPVVRYDAAVYDGQATLRGEILEDGRPRCRNLLEGIAWTMLVEAARGLRRMVGGEAAPEALGRDPEDILRAAGRWMTSTAAHAAGPGLGITGLFDEINQMASLLYEGREATGRMIVSRVDHPSIRRELVLEQAVPIGEAKWARKMLEMSSPALCLLTDSLRIHALGGVTVYDSCLEDLFDVEFAAAQRWALRHDRRALMHVLYGIPALPEEPLGAEAFHGALRAHFGDLPEDAIARIWSVVRRAPSQRYGALVVVAEEAHDEASRLANQGAAVEPRFLTDEMADRVMQIDGAVLLDPGGLCHAVGVILDGTAAPDVGSPARGARFNSAARYVHTADRPAIAIVVSEDGTVEVIGSDRVR
jgi:hypothetical protein